MIQRICRRWRGLLAGLLALTASSPAPAAAPPTPIAVGIFSCDITPPLGHPLCGGWIKPLEAVEDPLLAKGIVLEQGGTRYVLCVVDWCLLQTEAFERFRGKIATAAGVPASQVSVHTVHQHNAPIADARAQRLLDAIPGGCPMPSRCR